MQTSPTTAKLDEALAKAQGEFLNPEKNRTVTVKTRTGGSYSFDYATFDAIVDVARPALAKHGICVSQFPSTKEVPFVDVDQNGQEFHGIRTIVTVITRIACGGEWMTNEISGPCESADMQKIGSAITYLQRYSYASMLGIVSEFDDDGNAAAGNEAAPSERQSRASLPICDKCGTNKAVIVGKPEFGGGLVCFTKKGGCGKTWSTPEYPATGNAPDATPAAQQPPATADKKAKSKAQKVAAEHGLKTGDEVSVPPAKPAKPAMTSYEMAIDALKRADTLEKVKQLEAWVREHHQAGKISEMDYLTLGGKLADRNDELKNSPLLPPAAGEVQRP